MKAGDVIFVRGHSIIDDAIRHFDPGAFSHCAIAISDTEIFEAQGNTLSHITEMNYTDFQVIYTQLSDEEIARLKVLCQLLEGRPYDYIQDLGYVFVDLFHADINKFNDPHALICSEAVALVLYLLGRLDQPLRNITPNQLFALMEKRFVN